MNEQTSAATCSPSSSLPYDTRETLARSTVPKARCLRGSGGGSSLPVGRQAKPEVGASAGGRGPAKSSE